MKTTYMWWAGFVLTMAGLVNLVGVLVERIPAARYLPISVALGIFGIAWFVMDIAARTK